MKREKYALTSLLTALRNKRAAGVLRSALALALVLIVALPVLAPSDSVLSAPEAKAQTEVLGSASVTNNVIYGPSGGSTYTMNVTADGTVNSVVLQHKSLTVPTNTSTAEVRVNGVSVPYDSASTTFAAGKWTFSGLSAAVNSGDQIQVYANYTRPLSGVSMTVYGTAGPSIIEVTPEEPTVVDPGVCGVQKTVNIPDVEGVIYISVDNGDSVTITADAAEGYAIADGATRHWILNISATPCDDVVFNVNGNGSIVLGGDQTTGSGTGPYTTTVSAQGESTFEKVIVRFDKNGKTFSTSDFSLNVSGFADGTTEVGSTIVADTPDYVEIEYYPMRDGVRIDSAELNDGATFDLTSTFDPEPAGTVITMTVYGNQAGAAIFPPADNAPLPQSDQVCEDQNGTLYLKKWWQTGNEDTGVTHNVSMLELKLANASAIDPTNRNFRVQYGNTGAGFMNLSYGLDFTVRVDGDSLFIIFSNPLKAPPHEYSDFHVWVPGGIATNCGDNGTLTIWGEPKNDPDTGTEWRKDTDEKGGVTQNPTPAPSGTLEDYVYLLNGGQWCWNDRWGIESQWHNVPGEGDLNGDLAALSVDIGPNDGSLADFSNLKVAVFPGTNWNDTPITIGPGGYTLEIKENRLYIYLNDPIAPNGAEWRNLQVNLGAPRVNCNLDTMKIYREAREIPQVCTGEDIVSPAGETIPYMGNGTAVVNRQPARELTAEERAEGHRVYVSASPRNLGQGRYSTQLYYQPQNAENFVPIGGETGWVINALGYNAEDNWLYAISQPRIGNHRVVHEVSGTADGGYTYKSDVVPLEDPCYPAGHLLQINPVTGEVHNLGRVTKPGTDDYAFAGEYDQQWANDLWGGLNNGFFDGDGNFWVNNASLSGSGALYKVNLDTVTGAVRYGDSTDHNSLQSNYRVEDYTTLPTELNGESYSSGNYAWGIRNFWVTEDGKVYLERVDLRNGSSELFDITNLVSPTGEKIPADKNWGKAWTYGNGDLGFGTGSSGATADGVRIKIVNPDSPNPTFELVSVMHNVPVSYNTNATSNGSVELQADLKLTKEALGMDTSVKPPRMKWRVTVSNVGPDGSSGFVLDDKLPAGYSDITVDSNPSGAYVTIDQNTGTMQAIFGALRENSSVSLEFSAAALGEDPKCAPNTATVTGNEVDPNPDNNTSTADCPPPAPDINILLQKVDAENNTVKLDASFQLFETGIAADGSLQPVGDGIAIDVNADGTTATTTVTSGKTYFLVETKAPDGYSLLPKPVLIKVTRDDQGVGVVEFLEQKNGFPASIVPPQEGDDPNVITIQIADISTGELPKTGGTGVGIVALAGLLIVIAGAFVARRGRDDS